MYGDWESIGSTQPKYRLTISAHWFTLKKIEAGKEVELEHSEFIGFCDTDISYVIKGGKSTYRIPSFPSEELVLGRGIGNPVAPQYEILAHFQKLS
jgi:hypothetical protein